MRRILLLFTCLAGTLAVTNTYGQYTSGGGRFKVDQIKGCAPFTISITDTNLMTTNECTAGKPCLMDFEGNGGTTTNTFTHTYTTPGTYKLSVLYQSAGTDDITVTVVDNVDPTFDVFSCKANKVEIKVVDKSYDTYLIDFKSDHVMIDTIPNGNNAIAQHTYGSPGSYNITVRGKNLNAADNCKNLSESYQTLTVLPTPSLNVLTAVDANNLKLDMTTAAHIDYKLEIAVNNASTFQSYEELYEQTSVNIPNLLVDDNYYCFRLNAFDPCDATNTYSTPMCSQDLDVAFNNGSNDLTWKTSATNATSLDIIRNSAPYSINKPAATFSFKDSDYDCNQQYCYQVVEYYSADHTRKSTSLAKCGIGVYTVTYPAIENVSTVIRDGAAELTYSIDPLIKKKITVVDIMKSVGGSSFDQYATLTPGQQPYIDTNYDVNGGSCYQVNYNDNCGNNSAPGIIACPMALSASINENNTVVSLIWNGYHGYQDGVINYQVNQSNLTTGVFTTDTTFIDNDPDNDKQIVTYRIVAIGKESDTLKSYSNTVTITKPLKLITPTAFTPNGDAINQSFTVTGKFVTKVSLDIFDRWGVLVFSSAGGEMWDGTKDGKPLPESAYVWKAEITDMTGKTVTQQGTVVLLRPKR